MVVTNYFLDGIPVWAAFVLLVLGGLVVFELGYQLGDRWQRRTPDEKEGSTGLLVGSLLALLGFLLAITMGMAADRFNTRRALVLEEANAIGTTYLRAGYLPAPHDQVVRDLLRTYVPLRITSVSSEQLRTNLARSVEIQTALWDEAQGLARETPDSVVLGLFIESLNDVIDLHEERVVAGSYARVPESILILLVLGGALTLAMVGFNAGLSRRRSLVGATILILVMSATITLVIDLDRPRDGFLTTSQQAMIDLQSQLGVP